MSIIGTKEMLATITINESLSASVNMKGFSVLRITMPPAWDAADLTFQVSDDGGSSYNNVYWDWGPEMVVDAAASIVIELSPFVLLHHIDQIKIRSGTAGVPVAQSGTVEVILVLGVR